MTLQSTAGDNCIWRSDFTSPQTVAAGGGTVTGALVFNKGVTAVASSRVVFKNTSGLLSNTTKCSFHIKRFCVSELANNGYLFSKYPAGGDIQFLVMWYSQMIRVYVGSGSNYADLSSVISAGGTYDIEIVYDGSLTAANRLKVYVNGVVRTLNISGTIPASLSVNSGRFAVFGQDNISNAKVGMRIEDIIFFPNYALSQAEVTDLVNGATIPELDRPIIDLPLRSWYYNGSSVAVTENKGTLGGTATLGNGTTTTTFPTFTSPSGIQTDGGDYLQIDCDQIVTPTSIFSVTAYLELDTLADDSTFFSNLSGGVGVDSYFSQNLGLRTYFFDGANYFGLYHIGTAKTSFKNVGVYTVTYDGTKTTAGIKCYRNGVLLSGTPQTSGTVTNVSTSNLYLFRQPAGGLPANNGERMKYFKIHSRELTPQQVNILHKEIMKSLNI